MRIFKTELYLKSSKKLGIANKALLKIAEEMKDGNKGDKIGECLYKKRLPRPGSGKSGGYRTLVTYQDGDRLFFIFVYERKEANKKKEVLDKDDIKALALFGLGFLIMDEKDLEKSIRLGILEEITQ